MRDCLTQSKKSVIVFQIKMDPDVMLERQLSTVYRGRIIEMSDFFTKNKKLRNCLSNENRARFHGEALAKYSIQRAND